MDENDFSNELSENETPDRNEDEMTGEEPKKSIHDHPFSIESILNGRTRRRKPKVAKNASALEDREEPEERALPLSALEEFTNKAFSTMKPERRGDEDEGAVLFYFLFWPIFHKLDAICVRLTPSISCYKSRKEVHNNVHLVHIQR